MKFGGAETGSGTLRTQTETDKNNRRQEKWVRRHETTNQQNLQKKTEGPKREMERQKNQPPWTRSFFGVIRLLFVFCFSVGLCFVLSVDTHQSRFYVLCCCLRVRCVFIFAPELNDVSLYRNDRIIWFYVIIFLWWTNSNLKAINHNTLLVAVCVFWWFV